MLSSQSCLEDLSSFNVATLSGVKLTVEENSAESVTPAAIWIGLLEDRALISWLRSNLGNVEL